MKHSARKALTAVAAAGLTATAALVAVVTGAGPAAAYGPTANSLGCRLYFDPDGEGSSATTWADTFSLTTSPATPTPGQTVTVKLTAAAGPTNGPVALAIGSTPVYATVKIAGSQSGTVTLTQANYPAAKTAGYAKLGAFEATGSFVASAAGAGSLTVAQLRFANPDVETYCSDVGDRDQKRAPVDTTIVENYSVFGGGASITSVTGQTVTGYARKKNTINFSVTGLAPSATLTASLTDSTGGGTGEGSGTGTTDASGAGTGTLVVPDAPTAGSRAVSISDGTHTLTLPITILGSPTVAITPAGGGAGTAITVTGTNWDPGSTVTVGGYTGAGSSAKSSDAQITVTASATGTISTSFTVNDTTTKYIGASAYSVVSGAIFGFTAWAASADGCVAGTTGCKTTYQLSETVTAGNLAMSRGTGTSTITFSGVTLNGSAQSATGTLPAINVTDNRGSTFGWSLTGAVSDFTGVPAGTIAKSALTWTPACSDHTGVTTNAVVALAGAAGAVDGATLCSAPIAATGTGGSFDASAGLSLAVPPNQLAGAYSATLTITLS
ncbi:hypothetical protein BJ973_003400 [Actinoplanes tereljensis]|uniref:WxL domain-containing protein n=1 Tax=Paractinoplanes tereljensis TaxID=571912 RepID=A0A919NXN1_9ACTN|nr:hypothetical protein [Actinoplanes tereljensis]GIF26130.1 hypothetical protein Ate02nite_88600 [Actinoplanes tereljensis]